MSALQLSDATHVALGRVAGVSSLACAGGAQMSRARVTASASDPSVCCYGGRESNGLVDGLARDRVNRAQVQLGSRIPLNRHRRRKAGPLQAAARPLERSGCVGVRAVNTLSSSPTLAPIATDKQVADAVRYGTIDQITEIFAFVDPAQRRRVADALLYLDRDEAIERGEYSLTDLGRAAIADPTVGIAAFTEVA